MSKFIFHIGRGKCGSSALQSALTTNQSIGDTKRLIYASISDKGIAYNEKLEPGLVGYQSSADAQTLSGYYPKLLSSYTAELLDTGADHIVLSNEGWHASSDIFRDQIFPAMKLSRPSVVMYVRPQAQYMNSAWWQWGAWNDTPIETWYINMLRHVCWSESIEPWTKFADVTVRILPKDIFTDFLGLYGYSTPRNWQTESVNKSLPASVLRLYQARRDLRPGPHASSIDSVLAKAIDMPGTPWVITHEMVQNIIHKTKSDNELLLKILDTKSAMSMRNDPRWWDASAYKDKTISPADGVLLSQDELETLSVQLAMALMQAEQKIVKYKKEHTQNNDHHKNKQFRIITEKILSTFKYKR